MTNTKGEVCSGDETPIQRFTRRVEAFRDGAAKEAAELRKKSKRLTVQKRDALYATIQEAYCIATELMDPANKAVLDKLLEDHDIKRSSVEGSNPWMPVTNLLFGKWVRTGQKDEDGFDILVFKPDLSAKKYAVSFRYFQEHQWEPELIVDNLRDPKTGDLISFGKLDGKQQKGLVGTEKWGRYEHRDGADEEAEEQRLQDRNRDNILLLGKSLGAIAINDLTNRSIEDGEYVLLWGKANCQARPRVVEIYGELRGTQYSRTVRNYLDKAVKELRAFLKKHVVGGKPIGKGNEKPKLLGDNIINAVVDAWRKQEAAKAAKAAEEAPQKPVKARPARKGIKTGPNVNVESPSAQHKPMSQERIRELAVKLANDRRRSKKTAAA